MMFFLKKMSTVALAAMTIALIPAVGRAETPAEISPKALSILQRAHDFLKKEHFYSFQANISADEVLPPAFKIEYHSVANFKVRRPNGVFVEFVGDRRTANFYYDGFQLTLWDKVKNVYATIAAPSTIDETISLIDTKYNFSFPIDDFISSNFYKALTEKIKTGYYIGTSVVEGVPTYHLAFSQDNIDWQIWIDQGESPLPRKIVIIYKNLPGSPQYAVIFSHWNFQSQNNNIFSFKPPTKAVKIDFLPVISNSQSKSTN